MSNTFLTDAEIERLISCEKVFVSKPREATQINKNYQQKFVLRNEESGNEFTVFIAWSILQQQDFSVGLMFGDNLLLRVNGFHGTTRAGYHAAPHHAAPHIHMLTAKDINNGRQANPSRIVDASGKYVDLISARLFFFQHCGIIGYEDYFPSNKQMSLDDFV